MIHGLSLGDGYFAAITGYGGNPDCQANILDGGYVGTCDWTNMGPHFTPSIRVESVNPLGGMMTYTGMYTPIIALPYVPPEPVNMYSYIAYTV